MAARVTGDTKLSLLALPKIEFDEDPLFVFVMDKCTHFISIPAKPLHCGIHCGALYLYI